MLVQGDERQRLVEEILNSAALGRSEQLRRLLRYLANEEAAGRGPELTEYSIGVNALGRRADYAPDVDSTVRTRVHELRRRLEEHYRQNPEVDWRLELPKGSYRLRCSRRESAATPETVLQTVVQLPAAAPTEPPRAAGRVPFLSGLACGVLVLGLAWAAAHLWTTPGERAARLIWGPMLTKGETITLLLATPPQLWIREFGTAPTPIGDPPRTFRIPNDPALLDWYARTTLRQGEGLILHPNNHSPLGGEANAAITLAAFAAERRARVELLAGEHTGATEIRDRNAVVLGRAEYSDAAAALQPADGWAVRYVPERREVGIVPLKGGAPSFFREKGGTTNYGLITVLTKPSDGGAKRTILFAGINSDGSEAAMSYLTSLLQLQELAAELGRGRSGLPESYQVVVRSQSSNTRSLRAERVALRVLD